jgi:hypothetical protein
MRRNRYVFSLTTRPLNVRKLGVPVSSASIVACDIYYYGLLHFLVAKLVFADRAKSELVDFEKMMSDNLTQLNATMAEANKLIKALVAKTK